MSVHKRKCIHWCHERIPRRSAVPLAHKAHPSLNFRHRCDLTKEKREKIHWKLEMAPKKSLYLLKKIEIFFLEKRKFLMEKYIPKVYLAFGHCRHSLLDSMLLPSMFQWTGSFNNCSRLISGRALITTTMFFFALVLAIVESSSSFQHHQFHTRKKIYTFDFGPNNT